MKPITIDLSGLQDQFGLAADSIDLLTETCVNAVTASIYSNWEALAKQKLNSTAKEYISNLITVDKGRFNKQIVLTGVLPNMIEQGASPFDIKEGFRKSSKVKFTIPVYNKKGEMVKKGGDWYLTIPFRVGTPNALGQAGFSGIMPQEVYDIMLKRDAGKGLPSSEIPSPYEVPKSRETILNETGSLLYDSYQHKNSVYEGVMKNKAQYNKTSQNTYGSFRRAGANSSPLSWIHRGIKAYHLVEEAINETDVDTIVSNEVTNYLDTVL